MCTRSQECFSLGFDSLYPDLDSCLSVAETNCNSSLTAPHSGLTDSILNDCANGLAGLTCDQLLGSQIPAACIPKGSVADGAACGDDWQCEGGHCSVTGNAACGVCTHLPVAGEPCGDGRCADGLRCASGTCVVPSEKGDACDATHPCRLPNVCAAGACAPGATAGEACDPETNPCDALQGLFCDSTTSRCRASVFAESGAACGDIDGAPVVCRASICSTPSGSSTGTCTPRSASGRPCTSSDTCEVGLQCIDGTCAPRDPASCG